MVVAASRAFQKASCSSGVIAMTCSRAAMTMHWANREVLRSLRDSPAARETALPLMSHILVGEHIWLSRLKREQVSRPVWPHLTLDECEALAAESADNFAAFFQGLGESDLDATVRFQDGKGMEYTMAIVDILIHIATHGAYHRGQVATAVARSGGQSVNTDYINFARTVEPIEG